MEDPLTIGEVSSRVGLATSALRFYERQGLISSTRTPGGQRRYDRSVVRRVSFIRAAQAVGISLGEIGEHLNQLPSARTPTREDWEEVASRWRPRLDEQISALNVLRDKLDRCIGCGCLSIDLCALYNPRDFVARLGPGPQYLLAGSIERFLSQ